MFVSPLILIILLDIINCNNRVEVKVVESHSKVNIGQVGQTLRQKLTPSRSPSLLCGHSALNQIVGRCYDLEVLDYKYVVCPFDNITQHEIATRWNAYHGILGVWSHWSYDPLYTTLTTGHYTDGDTCTKKDTTTIPRSVTLNHFCGKITQVTAVSEPDTCQYNMTLTSPLFCHDVLSDVYNALPDDSPRLPREEYARATAEYKYNVLTEMGLKEARRKVLEGVGCLNARREFGSAEECAEEFHEMKERFRVLEDKCGGDESGEDRGEERGEGKKYEELERKYLELRDMLADNGLLPPDM